MLPMQETQAQTRTRELKKIHYTAEDSQKIFLIKQKGKREGRYPKQKLCRNDI